MLHARDSGGVIGDAGQHAADLFARSCREVYRKAVAAADQKHAQSDQWNRFEIDRMLLELADHDGDVDRAVVLLLQGDHPRYGGIIERLDRAGRPRRQ